MYGIQPHDKEIAFKQGYDFELFYSIQLINELSFWHSTTLLH